MKYDGRFIVAHCLIAFGVDGVSISGKAVTLSEEAEEVAGFFAALLETDHARDKTFRKNFFEDWLKVLKPRSRTWRNVTSDQCTNTLKFKRTRRSN
jgi:DNA topoisomerase IB